MEHSLSAMWLFLGHKWFVTTVLDRWLQHCLSSTQVSCILSSSLCLWCWEMSVVRSGVELTGSQDWDFVGTLSLPLLLPKTVWHKTTLLGLKD